MNLRLIHPLTPLIHPLTPLIHPLTPLIHPFTPLIHPFTPLIHPFTPLVLFCLYHSSAMHGQWVKSNEFTQINEGKLLAPGNLRASQDNKGYADLFNYWMTNMYQLR